MTAQNDMLMSGLQVHLWWEVSSSWAQMSWQFEAFNDFLWTVLCPGGMIVQHTSDFLWSTQGEKYTYIHLNLLISGDESPAVLFNYNWSFLFTKIIKKKEHR